MLGRLPLIAAALFACAATPESEERVEKPHLVALIRTSDTQSTQWYREAYPALKAAGWRIQVYQVAAIPPLSAAGPVFHMPGHAPWRGYHGIDRHYADIRSVVGSPKTDAPARR